MVKSDVIKRVSVSRNKCICLWNHESDEGLGTPPVQPLFLTAGNLGNLNSTWAFFKEILSAGVDPYLQTEWTLPLKIVCRKSVFTYATNFSFSSAFYLIWSWLLLLFKKPSCVLLRERGQFSFCTTSSFVLCYFSKLLTAYKYLMVGLSVLFPLLIKMVFPHIMKEYTCTWKEFWCCYYALKGNAVA